MADTTLAVSEAADVERTAPRQDCRASWWRYPIYCLIVVSLPALFLLSSIFIVRSKSFPVESHDPFLLNPDYAYSLSHVNCDVVVFGDSTAITGVDPTVIEKSTGLKTCNIAQSQSILALLGTAALDNYLQSNEPPKYLVIQLGPESFSRDHQQFYWPEGITLLLRKKFGLRTLLTLVAHPQQTYGFAIWAIKAKLGALGPAPNFIEMEATFRSRSGLLILPKPPETGCVKHGLLSPPTLSWIKGLREKYSVNGTQVLIDVAPIPACENDMAQIAASLAGVTDNTLPVYPISLFSDLDRHLTMVGAERSTEEIAQQIQSRQQRQK
ncbi:MAG: hypothetical protein WAK33_03915 [Silvibacterium sp.]